MYKKNTKTNSESYWRLDLVFAIQQYFELLNVPQKKSDFYKALHKLNNQISVNFPVKGGNFIFGLMQFTKSAPFPSTHIYDPLYHSFLV